MTKNMVPSTISLGIALICMFLSGPISPAQAETYQPRRSNIVKAFMYDEDTQTLTVYFLNGIIHQYQSVPERIYQGLKDAPLKGGYYQTWIEGQYEKVDLHSAAPSPDPAPDAESEKRELKK